MRVPITHIVQSGSGETQNNADGVRIYDPNTEAEIDVYDAETGGNLETQPLPIDEHGRVVDGSGNTLWAERPGIFQIQEVYGNSVRIIPWNAYGAPMRSSSGWTDITNMQSNWVAYDATGTSWPKPRWRVMGDGLVVLSGLAKSGGAIVVTNDGQLPEPADRWEIFNIHRHNNTTGRADIVPNGTLGGADLWLVDYSSSWTSLEGIQYRTEEVR
jgi:hypothetical protein